MTKIKLLFICCLFVFESKELSSRKRRVRNWESQTLENQLSNYTLCFIVHLNQQISLTFKKALSVKLNITGKSSGIGNLFTLFYFIDEHYTDRTLIDWVEQHRYRDKYDRAKSSCCRKVVIYLTHGKPPKNQDKSKHEIHQCGRIILRIKVLMMKMLFKAKVEFYYHIKSNALYISLVRTWCDLVLIYERRNKTGWARC